MEKSKHSYWGNRCPTCGAVKRKKKKCGVYLDKHTKRCKEK